ncbi:MAG: hypothetical protein GY869_26795 [Planctomycetes bacterium]|nr:hypothetical protein [Planctomycetota bacterium]
MQKNLEDKIIAEIIDRVIEEDEKLRRQGRNQRKSGPALYALDDFTSLSQKQIDEIKARASLNGLDEVTLLTREQIDDIAAQVRAKYERPRVFSKRSVHPPPKPEAARSCSKIFLILFIIVATMTMLIIGLSLLTFFYISQEIDNNTTPGLTIENNPVSYKLTFAAALDENNDPLHPVEDAAIGSDRIVFYNTWINLSLDREYIYSSKVFDGNSETAFIGEGFSFTPTTDPYYTWTRYNFDQFVDSPGQWCYEAYLDGEKMIDTTVTVHDNKAIFTTALNENNDPIDELDEVTLDYKKVYIYVTLNELVAERDYVIRTKIFDSTGNLIVESNGWEFKTPGPSYLTWFDYTFEPETDRPGDWRFEIYLDNEKIIEKTLKVLTLSAPNQPVVFGDQEITYRAAFTTGVNDNHRPVDSFDEITLIERKVYFHVTWFSLRKGQTYNYYFKIFDGSWAMVYHGSPQPFTATGGTHYTWQPYTINPATDKPGDWRFEAYLNGLKTAEKILVVRAE